MHGEGAGPQLLRDEAYAIEQGYCVMNDDGTPYRVTDNWFKNSLLLDFTKPEAVKWWVWQARLSCRYPGC